MTIAVSLKVNDGVVLAADSASTLSNEGGILNVYNNANKVFNLYKGLPIGAITWGAGNIGQAAISTIMKDLRCRFVDDTDPMHIEQGTYTMASVAAKVREYVMPLYDKAYAAHAEKPPLGFVVAGHSAKGDQAEPYLVHFNEKGECPEPILLVDTERSGINWFGQPEAIIRLFKGYSLMLPGVLIDMGVTPESIDSVMATIDSRLEAPLIFDAMPIQDAIDLVEFLVDTAVKYSRFHPGAATVGGPVEIAVITKHEGFKWIKRKHYFGPELNR